MTDLDKNKQIVREFYELAFNVKRPADAVERYVGSRYVQHNPQAPDGTEAFIQFATAEDPGTVAADFFRLEDGKIVEHWDVLQPFPDTSANEHPMF